LLIAAAILLLAFGLRVWNLGDASLWVDEIYTYLRANGSVVHTLRTTLETGNHTPLYFVSTHLFPITHELTLRYSAALTGVIGAAVAISVIRKLCFNRNAALWMGLLVAVNPYAILLARMARPYALLLLLSFIVSYVFLRLITTEPTWGLWVLFIVVSAAAYMTHYFGLMLPLAQYATLPFVLKKKSGLLWRWLSAQILAGLPLLLWLLTLLAHTDIEPGIAWIPHPTPRDIAITLENLTVGYNGIPAWYTLLGLVIVGIGLIAGTYRAIQNRQKSIVGLYGIWLSFAPLVTVLAVSRFVALYVDRYFVVVLPGILLLIVSGLNTLPRRPIRIALISLLVITNMFSISTTLMRGTEEREAWRDAASIVKANYRAGDGLLVQRSAVLNAFSYYYGVDQIENLEVFGISDPQQGIYRLDEHSSKEVRRIWAIYDAPHDAHRLGPMPSPDPLLLDVSPITQWIVPRQQQILARHSLNGMTLLLVDVTEDFAVEIYSRSMRKDALYAETSNSIQ